MCRLRMSEPGVTSLGSKGRPLAPGWAAM